MAHDQPRRNFQQRVRALPTLLGNAHPTALIVAGLAIIGLGVLIVTRPLTSLTLLGVYIGISCIISGVADLGIRRTVVRRFDAIFAALWILAGTVILLWLGRSITALPVFLAVLLVISGVGKLAGVFRGSVSKRALSASFGLAEIAFGGLALSWPDVTLIVVAVLFAVRTIVFGMSLLWRAGHALFERTPTRRTTEKPNEPRSHRILVAGLRWTAAGVVVTLTIVTLTVSHTLRNGAPVVDGFYSVPETVPDQPGQLVRSDPYKGNLPAGVTARRILYTTTTKDGTPALASGVVAVPEPTGPEAQPVIAWNHGTNGIAQACAPSLTSNAVSPEAIPALDAIVRNGWAIVATDYTGEGAPGDFPYLVGETEARSSLDAVRAAHQLPSVNLSEQTLVWGHSQGGHAALWTSQIAPTYAPELDILGTAALSPASDPVALAKDITAQGGSGPIAVVSSYLLASFARSYADVELSDYVATSGRTIVEEIASRCVTEPGVLVSVLNSLAVAQDQPLFKLNLTTGPLAERLAENVPTGPFDQPLFIGHGEADEVISLDIQDAYVAARCRAGQSLEYRTYQGKNHMGVIAPGSPLNAELEQWTKDRLAGSVPASTCAD